MGRRGRLTFSIMGSSGKAGDGSGPVPRRPHVVARSNTGRVAKKRVEARTTEIDCTELTKLINQNQVSASPAPTVHEHEEVELVFSDAPAATRAAAPTKLAHTLRSGVMTSTGGVSTPTGGVRKLARGPIAEGSGSLPPAREPPLAAKQLPLPPPPRTDTVSIPSEPPMFTEAVPILEAPDDPIIPEEPTPAAKKSNVLAIGLLALLILASVGALIFQLRS
jgi:hypothetical protein